MPQEHDNQDQRSLRHYYVDEAGDPVLFGRRGRLLVGADGCSRHFMLGCLEVEDPDGLAGALADLRQEHLADPTLASIPSMQPERRKTALLYHAKDDVAEVRRDVFRLLMRHQVKFYGIVRRKSHLAQEVQQRNAADPTYRYSENEIYDGLVSRLFRDRLHKADHHEVIFARRGSKDRTQALASALDRARSNFYRKWGIRGNGTVNVHAASPAQHAGLQAVDYFLWALQRIYERSEERYFSVIWPHVRLIMDIDDTRRKPYGEWYNQRRPLTLACLEDALKESDREI